MLDWLGDFESAAKKKERRLTEVSNCALSSLEQHGKIVRGLVLGLESDRVIFSEHLEDFRHVCSIDS